MDMVLPASSQLYCSGPSILHLLSVTLLTPWKLHPGGPLGDPFLFDASLSFFFWPGGGGFTRLSISSSASSGSSGPFSRGFFVGRLRGLLLFGSRGPAAAAAAAAAAAVAVASAPVAPQGFRRAFPRRLGRRRRSTRRSSALGQRPRGRLHRDPWQQAPIQPPSQRLRGGWGCWRRPLG